MNGYTQRYFDTLDHAVEIQEEMLYGKLFTCDNCKEGFFEDQDTIFCNGDENVFCSKECLNEHEGEEKNE